MPATIHDARRTFGYIFVICYIFVLFYTFSFDYQANYLGFHQFFKQKKMFNQHISEGKISRLLTAYKYKSTNVWTLMQSLSIWLWASPSLIWNQISLTCLKCRLLSLVWELFFKFGKQQKFPNDLYKWVLCCSMAKCVLFILRSLKQVLQWPSQWPERNSIEQA